MKVYDIDSEDNASDDKDKKEVIIEFLILHISIAFIRISTGPLLRQRLLMQNPKDVSNANVITTAVIEYALTVLIEYIDILVTAHVEDSPGITESRGFRYVTAGIIFLVVITAIALTIYFVRKAQEEKSKKRFF